ncbi:hypothetical protein OIO90_003465 [Microbotryomycetes sp. JL221]|nr:hypothetical protein OIO90_003465 [Microbotryomycetes sp. JL221]
MSARGRSPPTLGLEPIPTNPEADSDGASQQTPTSPTGSSPWRKGSKDLPQESLALRRYKAATQRSGARPTSSDLSTMTGPSDILNATPTASTANESVPAIDLQAASPTVLRFPSPSRPPPPPNLTDVPSRTANSSSKSAAPRQASSSHTSTLASSQVLQNRPERTTSLIGSQASSTAAATTVVTSSNSGASTSKAVYIPSSPPPLSRSYAPTIPSPLSTSITSEFPFPQDSMPSVSEESSRAVSPLTPRRPSNPELYGHSSVPHEPDFQGRQRSLSGDYTSPSAQSTHWRSSSSVSSASRSPSLSSRAPLTPPESSGTGRHLTTAADLAWNDVLGGLGSLSFTGMGGFSSAGAATSGSGSRGSQIQQSDNLMSLEGGDDLAPKRTLPFVGQGNGTGNAVGSGSGNGHGVGMIQSRSGTPTEDQRGGKDMLMLGSGGGHFGPATRERLASLIDKHICKVPIGPNEKTLHIVEYGALDSRSPMLVPPVLSHFATRSQPAESEVTPSPSSPVAFQVTHCDKVDADFRPLSKWIQSSTESYLNENWLAAHSPSLENRVFSYCSSRPFASKVLPPGSVSFGFSAMALHWLSTDKKFHMPPATMAHGELMAFLSSRASETKPGGLFVMAYIARSEREAATASAANTAQHALNRGSSLTAHPHSLNMTSGGAHSSPASPLGSGPSTSAGTSPRTSPGQPTVPLPAIATDATRPSVRERSTSSPAVPVAKRRDIWDILSGFLGKAIQRLVSTQLLKPAVARLLLTLPIHPRSPKQTQAVLKALSHAWHVEEEEILLLSHPAWKGLEHQTVSRSSYADHTIQLIKIFWDAEMRTILRDSGMSRAACEWTLDSLWSVVREKLDEEAPQPLELEVQIVALRRKSDSP